MYCKTCGKEIKDNAFVCPYCGCLVGTTENDIQDAIPKTKNYENLVKIFGILGLTFSIISIFISLFTLTSMAGIILSAIGINYASKTPKKRCGLAIAGLIIGIISLVLCAVWLSIFANFYQELFQLYFN